MAMVAAGLAIVVAAQVVEAPAVGVGSDRREDQQDGERGGGHYYWHSTDTVNRRALAAMSTGGMVKVEVDTL